MSKEFKIGLIVTSAIFMLYWGANFLSGNNIFNPQEEYYAKYKSLDGLQTSNEVRFQGAKIGMVSGIEYDANAKDGYCWVVKFSITRENVVVMDSVIAEVGGADLLGTMILDMKNIHKGNQPLQGGDTLTGVLSASLSDVVQGQIAPLKAKTDDLLKELNTLVVSFREVLDSNTQVALKRSFASIPRSLNNIRHATESMDTIVDELKKARIANIIDNVASITNNLKKNNKSITKVIANIENITDSLAKANVKSTVERVNAVLAETNGILEKINKGEGSVGMLLNDKQLYENIILASADLDFLLMDLRENPSRYLNFSLLNFGSKKKKDPEPRDSAEYSTFFANAMDKMGLSLEKKDLSPSLIKEIVDSCPNGCDSLKLEQIFKKYE